MQISHALLDFCINKWTHEADVPGTLLEQEVINVLLGVLSDCSFSPPASLVSLCFQSTSPGVVRLIQPPAKTPSLVPGQLSPMWCPYTTQMLAALKSTSSSRTQGLQASSSPLVSFPSFYPSGSTTCWAPTPDTSCWSSPSMNVICSSFPFARISALILEATCLERYTFQGQLYVAAREFLMHLGACIPLITIIQRPFDPCSIMWSLLHVTLKGKALYNFSLPYLYSYLVAGTPLAGYMKLLGLL